MQPQDPQTPPTEPQVSTLQPQTLSQAGNAPVIVNTPPKKSKYFAVVAAIVIAALVLGGAAYALTKNKNTSKKSSKTSAIDTKAKPSSTPNTTAASCAFAAQLNIDNYVYAKLATAVAPDNACDEQQLKDFVQQAPTKSQQLDFLNSYVSAQKSARDTERKTDIYSILTNIEVYYAENNGYPGFEGKMNSTSWLTTNLVGLSLDAIKAPKQTDNSIVKTSTPTIDQYGYTPLDADGKTSCSAALCAKYIVYYRSEASGSVMTKTSLN